MNFIIKHLAFRRSTRTMVAPGSPAAGVPATGTPAAGVPATRSMVKMAGWIGMALLHMNITCVEIADKKGRKEQMENTASSLGEHILWKKIQKTKEVIDEVYTEIHRLQDSIDNAQYLANTVLDLGVASIEHELLELHDFRLDLDAYVSRVPNSGYALMVAQLYRREDMAAASEQFTDVIYYADPLPSTKSSLDQMIAERQQMRQHFNEFADKRALQAARIYRRWSRLYRDKGMELSKQTLTDHTFGMTDYERIEIQRLAQKYQVVSYEFIEKSDSILLSVSEYEDVIKHTQQGYLEAFLHLKHIYSP